MWRYLLQIGVLPEASEGDCVETSPELFAEKPMQQL
jgi:hypothetical protein